MLLCKKKLFFNLVGMSFFYQIKGYVNKVELSQIRRNIQIQTEIFK